MDEIIDIVNENCEVLYQTSKKEAHEKGLLHKTVIAEVITSKGEMVLAKQTSDRQDPGLYVNPVGGHVQAGESDEDALKREAEEEIGLKDFEYIFIGKAIYNREVLGRKENHYFLLYEIRTDKELSVGSETESYKTFTKTDLKKELVSHPEQFGGGLFFVVDHFYPELK